MTYEITIDRAIKFYVFAASAFDAWDHAYARYPVAQRVEVKPCTN